MTKLSKSQIDRLGDRLRKQVSDDDARLLNEFVVAQDPVRLEVETAVRRLVGPSVAVNSRLKTATTILEKLHRQKTRLADMQDVVGIRVVTPGGRAARDEVVQLLSVEWPRHKLYDRRKRPQFGYRAVHFVPTISGRPVEIQIRTSLQHKWAELFEKVADQWGRGIRYGESLPPAFADKANLVGYLQDIAEVIDAAEREDPRSAASIDANFDIFRRGLLMLEKL